MCKKVEKAHDMLEKKNGKGKDMLGWMDLPANRDEEEIARIKAAAERINKQADVFVVVGIGGSYLGAKAIIDIFDNTFAISVFPTPAGPSTRRGLFKVIAVYIA